jgi:2-succinyl-5-enolpyruvyl-6-hydroxy-3-cyclohexene-1-carboxylate synthase
MIDFRNLNSLWASIIVETFNCVGLTTAVVCPGSRSTPLTLAFAQHQEIDTIPILDERSAAFFALGKAKQLHLPVVLVCTSGTAGANFYPAAIEAKESRVPLIILTADRPPELRHCHAGQTIDQIKLYGNYPNWQTELALPEAELTMLRYLRQNIIHAWECALFPYSGVVHLNIPFREPLAPIIEPEIVALESSFCITEFFTNLVNYQQVFYYNSSVCLPLQQWQNYQKGIIIAGLAQPTDPEKYCQAIANLSEILQFPVLAEALSPLRNYADINPALITSYDLILRNEQLAAQLEPEIVIQLGELPISKQLRHWLENISSQRWIIADGEDNFDPLHGKTIHLRVGIEALTNSITSNDNIKVSSVYLEKWCSLEQQAREIFQQRFESIQDFYEGKIAWLISQSLPPQTPIFIANSMSVRNAEFFWQANNNYIRPYFNRGANGIDGTLSTALGIAHCHQSTVLITGDLALLHDTNGFLISNKFQGHLTIILVNNNGGGIFEMLPIAQFEPPFEEYFATPQTVDFAQLCQTYGVEYKLINTWQQLQNLLNPLPQQGIRVLEIYSDRKADAWWLQTNLNQLAQKFQ